MKDNAADVLRAVRDKPWLASLGVRRLLAWPLIRVQFAWHGVAWGTGWRIFGSPIIQKHRGTTISLGAHLTLRSWPASNPLAPYHPVVLSTRRPGAAIRVGKRCGFTGSTIVAANRIDIGDRVQLGANTTVVDTDFHPLTPERRAAAFNDGRNAPISIADDVFVGMNALILKGVRIGEGAVIGAGSVVTTDVPARTIAAGNPARVVGELPQST
jgi:acetyltransferase-like isoleucine patch superfamily enzyme